MFNRTVSRVAESKKERVARQILCVVTLQSLIQIRHLVLALLHT
jgi:hypothetical protein